MAKRIFADTILFLSIFFAPWYVAAGLGAVFVILFPRFWEAVLAGIFLDAMYYLPAERGAPLLYGRFGVFTALALVLILFIGRIKKQIRI